MRLINCTTLRLEEYFGDQIPRYAILSHTWGAEEVTFAKFTTDLDSARRLKGFRKIRLTCKQALKDSLGYAWVDTCCIDKSSSAELSEAINSMFAWYRDSEICYAFLDDVHCARKEFEFLDSRWFTRGWTLQELIAPHRLRFYDSDWIYLDTKAQYAVWIEDITGIPKVLFQAEQEVETLLKRFPVAAKMSWAANRTTSRKEDIAYCLLGLFGISMPLLYGEGSKAFVRLQEEIMKFTDDTSILAWGLGPRVDPTTEPLLLSSDSLKDCTKFRAPLLADTPEKFKNCRDIREGQITETPFAMMNIGLNIQLPLVPIGKTSSYYALGLLACSVPNGPCHNMLLGILVYRCRDGVYTRLSGSIESLVSGASFNTVIVDSKRAITADLQKTIILRDHMHPSIDESRRRRTKVIIEQKLDFQGNVTIIKKALPCWSPISGTGTTWDWTANDQILHMVSPNRTAHLVEFVIETTQSTTTYPKTPALFSVFLHTSTLASCVLRQREWSPFSDLHYTEIGNALGAKPQSTMSTPLEELRCESELFVYTSEKTIFQTRMIHLSLEAVRRPTFSNRRLWSES